MGFRKKFKSLFDKKHSHKEPVNTLVSGSEPVVIRSPKDNEIAINAQTSQGNVPTATGSSVEVPIHTSTTSIKGRHRESTKHRSPNTQDSKIHTTEPVRSGEIRIQNMNDTNNKEARIYGGGSTAETASAKGIVDMKIPIYKRTSEGVEARNVQPTSPSNLPLGPILTNTNDNESQGAPPRSGQPETAMLNGQQIITGGTFIQNVVSSDRRGFMLLEKRVATSAFHNSARRVDPPRCHPNTRVAIQQRIYDWIVMDLLIRQTWIMWMNGAAGAGKSAIIQSVAELCEKAQIPLATFFFFRTDDTRNTMAPLIATIVYQLIQSIPQVQNEIFGIIESNPLIFDQSLEYQFQRLVIQPLLQLQEHFKSFLVVMIDGLDECIERVQQAYLINLLAAMSRSRTIPIAFLVSSRREPQIEAAFVHKGVSNLVQTLPLDNSDVEQTSDDIRHFLVDKFSDIRETHLFKRHIPADWPAASVVEEIVAKSSGQFIFASVVINYLLSPRANPSTQLDIIRGIRIRDPSSQNPFSHLDALYQHIFSKVENLSKVLDIIAFHLIGGSLNIQGIQNVFLLDPSELDVLFSDLMAVILCDTHADYAELEFLHASLPDFLLDKSRSEQYHIDDDEYRKKLLIMFLERPLTILDPLWSADHLEQVTWLQEGNRLFAILNFLKEAKASEQLRRAIMKFNYTIYNEFFLVRIRAYVPHILQDLKRLDFGDQGEAYRYVLDVFSPQYIKYWPLLSDYQKVEIKNACPDLMVRIDQIQQQAI